MSVRDDAVFRPVTFCMSHFISSSNGGALPVFAPKAPKTTLTIPASECSEKISGLLLSERYALSCFSALIEPVLEPTMAREVLSSSAGHGVADAPCAKDALPSPGGQGAAYSPPLAGAGGA